MTYPLIGNYGINLDDMESERPRLRGFVVREKCDFPNNWRCEMDLDGFLKQNKVMGIEGVDTRALTKVLRDHGTMKGIITTRAKDLTESQIAMKFETYSNKNVIRECTRLRATHCLFGFGYEDRDFAGFESQRMPHYGAAGLYDGRRNFGFKPRRRLSF